jgi:ABC-type glycerol-3-phosphate transport system permease component
MNSKDKWMWVTLLSFAAGGALPLFFVHFVEDSWQDRIWAGMFTTTAMFTYALFKRIGNRMPKLKKWAINSFVGATVLAFVSTFVASSAAVLFALPPLPHWLHITIGFCLALVALMLLIGESAAQ